MPDIIQLDPTSESADGAHGVIVKPDYKGYTIAVVTHSRYNAGTFSAWPKDANEGAGSIDAKSGLTSISEAEQWVDARVSREKAAAKKTVSVDVWALVGDRFSRSSEWKRFTVRGINRNDGKPMVSLDTRGFNAAKVNWEYVLPATHDSAKLRQDISAAMKAEREARAFLSKVQRRLSVGSPSARAYLQGRRQTVEQVNEAIGAWEEKLADVSEHWDAKLASLDKEDR